MNTLGQNIPIVDTASVGGPRAVTGGSDKNAEGAVTPRDTPARTSADQK